MTIKEAEKQLNKLEINIHKELDKIEKLLSKLDDLHGKGMDLEAEVGDMFMDIYEIKALVTTPKKGDNTVSGKARPKTTNKKTKRSMK